MRAVGAAPPKAIKGRQEGHLMRMLAVVATCMAALCGVPGIAAAAEAYPTRPITIIVPFAAGGPTDALVRFIGEPMRQTLGQPILIENITGAAGSIAVGRVVRAAPDGYTIGIGHWSTHVINGAFYQLPYDLLTDLEPISLLPSNPSLIVASHAVPAKNLTELVAWLKANPGKAAAGTAGAGSGSHVGGIYFESITGTHVHFVPYRGTGPALNDLVAGHIDLMIDQASNSIEQARAGTVRAFAVTAKARIAAAPDIPTVDEAGVPGLYISTWYGLWAPKGTPPEIIARLDAAVVDALADPVVGKRLADLCLESPPRDQQTPEALHAWQKAEIEKWWPLIRAANIKPE
jgi:tripartite-type tricarboxylate transporter receptor subunit TctC